MKLKSLLLGSAAALVALSGARAADAVIAEPEPVEYVRVCDAYGAGFFYIPGTETCLQLSGFVRFNIDMDKSGMETDTVAAINFDARSDTDYGLLRGYIALRAGAVGGINAINNAIPDPDGPRNSGAAIDEAFIQLGGLTIGTTYDYFDGIGIGGENDSLGGDQVNLISYNFASNGFTAGVALIDDNDNRGVASSDYMPNIQGTVGFSAGAFAVNAVAAYDNDSNEFAGKIRANVDVVEGGTLGAAFVYASGVTHTWSASEWSVAASYTQKMSDTLTASLGGQYWSDRNFAGPGSPDRWQIGANVDWTPVTNFLVRAQFLYDNDEGVLAAAADDTKGWAARLRFQRSF